jgi:hypothetical protein
LRASGSRSCWPASRRSCRTVTFSTNPARAPPGEKHGSSSSPATRRKTAPPTALCAAGFEYFKHSQRSTFAPLDGWIRRRLRNIPRKQHGRSGISRGFSLQEPMLKFASPLVGESSTGQPDLRDPHLWFGGRGRRIQSALPTPIGVRRLLDNRARWRASSQRRKSPLGIMAC